MNTATQTPAERAAEMTALLRRNRQALRDERRAARQSDYEALFAA